MKYYEIIQEKYTSELENHPYALLIPSIKILALIKPNYNKEKESGKNIKPAFWKNEKFFCVQISQQKSCKKNCE